MFFLFKASPSRMLSTIVRRHFLSLAMAPAISEPSLNSMAEMLTFLHMRDSTQSPAVLLALTLHALCVGQPLEVLLKKHVQTWLQRMETGKSMILLFTFKQTPIHHSLSCSFYLMVYAYNSYTDGNLQFFGNAQSVELDGECTGRECQTEGGVTTPPPPPPPGGTSKLIRIIFFYK